MQFLSPWFLLGALAVGVPIWLHLIRRQQALRIPFSSLMFFRRIPTKSLSRQRLKYLLLLSLRVLVILLIVGAFARPIIPGVTRVLLTAGQGRHAVILLDNSMSMQYGDRWERALEAAREVIADLRETDQAQIVTFSSDFQIQNLPTSDKAALRTVLEGGLPVSASPTSYAQGIRAAEQIAEDARQPLAVVLISDLQKSGWAEQSLGPPVPPAEEFRLVDVGEPQAPNWTVESVRSRRTIYQSRYSDQILARVTGFGTPETTKQLILSVGGRIMERKSIQIPASGTVSVVFEGFETPLGDNGGEIRLAPPDSLPTDDIFHFALERREPYRLLFLREPGEEKELYYFQNALAAEPDSPFQVEARAPAQASSISLSDYQMVALSNVASLPPAFASELVRFVQQGGGLLITLGTRFPDPELETRLEAVWPARGIEKRWMTGDADRLVLLGEFDTEHPLFREFQQSGTESLRQVETYAYVRLQAQDHVLLRFANGDPALVEKKVGRGRVLLYASTFDNVWSDLPLHPAFVPLVHQMVQYGVEMAAEPLAYTIPTTIALENYKPRDNSEEQAWVVLGPEGKREVPLAEELRPDFVSIRRPGFYQIRFAQKTSLIAANPDPRESDLAQLPAEDRELWLAGFRAEREATAQASSLELAKRQTIWWNLLILAFLVALAEAYLANQYLKPPRAGATSESPQETSHALS
ncbi:MAG: hypothetical protein A3H27_16675 [Acidobacteria bacterium RIFCSPLOWO2_02_FULL_59_13]|nr:MAG: hypothetical protein A3H27_16675 [Acidobacteria bacterium RIFCSPLOWO2_02_FULL_59_13]